MFPRTSRARLAMRRDARGDEDRPRQGLESVSTSVAFAERKGRLPAPATTGESGQPTQRYCRGENEEGRRILFACANSVSPPPGGGHTPISLALFRIAIRSSMLL